ncbi:glycine/betaine ABC transporter [Bacillus coahuilensis m2-6]|uniref:ABC transporter permease n=1 Tax=Bacillus coahuilensis TaxID=408580 RepID=UPI0007503CDF|nr:proline/glycine betaine ABC transporter permease [Bacillus coahuilensis]KUP08302.1 glycine/betaine ABC transporter [Bacillus coahuilensis m2-6]
MNNIPRLPVKDWVDSLVDWIQDTFEEFFEIIDIGIENFVEALVFGLNLVPAFFMIFILTGLGYMVTKKWGLPVFTLVGFLFILNIGYWEATLQTLALVLTAVLISVIVGVPLGIWSSQKKRVEEIITPILDFMQTMPAFVYLIPCILFFSIGVTPGIIASVIFAMPPTIRLTNLGIRQVPEDLVEASNAFGSTTGQKLFKVQLPLATKTIMAGINQSIMLSLSMVVIASLVGAPGLGVYVYRAVTRIEVGTGFEAGLSIVILAIFLDRITQNLKTSNQ